MISSLKLYKLLTDHVGVLNHLAVQLRDEAITKEAALPQARAASDALQAALAEE
jgi:hypothetical protein